MRLETGRRIIIVGGGIGGLAAALGLARKRFSVIVLEKAPALGEIGAGMQLAPNAFHALDYLGVGHEARAKAVFVERMLLMDAMSGEEITSVPLGAPFRRRFGNPYAVVHRGDLHGVLLEACRAHPKIEVRVGNEVLSYEQRANSVTVRLASGDYLTGAALIGADGLWSNVRKQVVGDGIPRISGHMAYRSLIPTERLPDELRWNAGTIWAGPKCHIVHYPVSNSNYLNLVAIRETDRREMASGKPVSQEKVLGEFECLHNRVRAVIERGSEWTLWSICDRDPVDDWVDGRVALLGDAAHPMMPYMAQGACMALEDAVCLAHAADTHDGDLKRAFEDYRARRVLRTARVQLQARAIGDHIVHPAGVHAALRNSIMRGKSADDWYDSLQWLYGDTGLSEAFATTNDDVIVAQDAGGRFVTRERPVAAAAVAGHDGR
jgi:2-polyprenyl-6-methoxyphenol hydroxylase-like FAD-dependent oxidoreductase